MEKTPLRVPQTILDFDLKPWSFKTYSPKDKALPLVYSSATNTNICLDPIRIETKFSKVGRQVPSQAIIQQGKYECAASALAMLLGEKLFTVKRAMGKFEWRNDDGGATDEMVINAARFLGYDLMEIDHCKITSETGPCLLTIQSLNVPKMNHALTWTGKEILDPNWEKAGRFWWGVEWSPWTLPINHALVLLPFTLSESERKELDLLTKKNNEAKINELKKSVLEALNSLK